MNYEYLKKLEELAEAFLNAEEANREKALAMMNEHERKVFVEYVGLYKLLTDEAYYKAVQNELCEKIYKEVNGGD